MRTIRFAPLVLPPIFVIIDTAVRSRCTILIHISFLATLTDLQFIAYMHSLALSSGFITFVKACPSMFFVIRYARFVLESVTSSLPCITW